MRRACHVWILLTALISVSCQISEADGVDFGVEIKSVASDGTITLFSERYSFPTIWDTPGWMDVGLSQAVARGWQTNYAVFGRALLEAWEAEHNDPVSLKSAIEAARLAPQNRGKALLPVAVHQTLLAGEKCLLIGLRWDGEGLVSAYGDIDHVRFVAVRQKDMQVVGFGTCD